MKVHVLAFAAHPDDAELSCAGTLLTMQAQGFTTGIIDLTKGELGSRGDDKTRANEAEKASEILSLTVRENLSIPDGQVFNTQENRIKVIRAIRKYQPDFILANAISDRHPDHGNAATLVRESAFLAGLLKIETKDDLGVVQNIWRPLKVWHYIQDNFITPDIIVDITPYFEKKLEAIAAFDTQFYKQGISGPETLISSKMYWHFFEARAREMGHMIGVEFGEGYKTNRTPGVRSLYDCI